MDHAVPLEVVAALLSAGYRTTGSATTPTARGRSGEPGAWSAVTLDGTATEVVVQLVDLAVDPRHAARLDRLVSVRHDHLAHVREVVTIGPHTRALLVDRVAGPTLAALGRSRGPLSPAEAVTLTVPVADALEALHGAGLVHGDVSPSHVVIALDGRPMLVDLITAVTGSAGHPDFAAPEVVLGQDASPAADVYALARTVLHHLEPEPPGPRETEDRPGPATDARRLRDLLVAAAEPDPSRRWGARELADACFRAHEPEPIVLPDVAVLARTELVAGAARPTGAAREPGREARRGSRAHRALPARPARPRRAPSQRLPARAVAVLTTIVVLGVSAAVLGPLLTDARTTPTLTAPTLTAPTLTVATSAADSPDTAARTLTEVRTAVLASGDPDRLADVEVVGSAAHAADRGLMADLATQGLRIDGLGVQVSDARTVDSHGVDARVAVTSATTGYRTVAADGTVVSTVPAGSPRTVVLVLVLGEDGWRVSEVLEEATATSRVSGVSSGP